jgi:hypothetical protein
MRTATIALLAATLLLAGCGGNPQASKQAAATSSTAVDPQKYGDSVVRAFRSTYPDAPRFEGDRGPASDWSAFVSVVRDLPVPDDLKVTHEQMLAAFEAYVAADQKAETVCEATPGPGGPCFTAVSDTSDLWAAALDRAYEIPGVTWARLLG